MNLNNELLNKIISFKPGTDAEHLGHCKVSEDAWMFS